MKKTNLIMHARMQMYRNIRTFFDNRNVIEVETPILSPYGTTDVHIDSFSTLWDKQNLYLHTSPEFAMKCLLAEGIGDCFQIAKVFRNEPAGKNHRPEFSMLEWYRVGFSLQELIDEVGELCKTLIPRLASLPIKQITYAEAFSQINVNPHQDSLLTLKEKTEILSGYLPNLSDHRDEWLDFLLVTQIEPKLGKNALTFLTHYPASMAALAKKTVDVNGYEVAERFELYYEGIELANGFDELTDADEQLSRFQLDNIDRAQLEKPIIPLDEDLIVALRCGMPNCSGVAIGLDRLLMVAENQKTLDDINAFLAPQKN